MMMSNRKTVIENAIIEIDRNATDRQREAGKLYLRALEGDIKSKHALQEGIATSDIPEVLTPVVNIQFLAQYADQPIVWDSIVDDTVESVSLGKVEFGGFDFDTSALLGDHDGDTYVGAGLPGVGEYGEYPAVVHTSEELEAELRKGGVRLRISWEALIKLGNFDMIGAATRAFARYAAEQEDIALAKRFVSSAGVVNSDFAQVTGNPALTLSAVEAAIQQSSLATVNGRPINARNYQLVVPTTLGQTARNILSITQVERTVGGDTFTLAPNTGGVSLTEFWALQSVGNYTTPGTMDDHWFLVPKGTARPAFVEVFLQGYRQPAIHIKDTGAFTLGGGAVPARDGSFELDDVEVKGRHVVGAAVIEPTGVVYSDGSGSGS
jgi:hypothetical protein